MVLARGDPEGLQDGDDEAESDGQRDHEEVVDGGDAELPPCEFEGIHEAALLRQAFDRDNAVAGYHHPSPSDVVTSPDGAGPTTP